MVIGIGDGCVRLDAPWTSVDSFRIERISPTKIELHSVMRNGEFHEQRVTVPKNVPLFKNLYGGIATAPSQQDLHLIRDARRVRRVAAHWIIQQSRPILQNLLDYLEGLIDNQPPEFIRGCLKCSISVGAITVTGESDSLPDRLIVGVSKDAHEQERLAEYASGFGDELET